MRGARFCREEAHLCREVEVCSLRGAEEGAREVDFVEKIGLRSQELPENALLQFLEVAGELVEGAAPAGPWHPAKRIARAGAELRVRGDSISANRGRSPDAGPGREAECHSALVAVSKMRPLYFDLSRGIFRRHGPSHILSFSPK